MKKSSVLLFSLVFALGLAAQTFSVVENDTMQISNVPLEQYSSYYIDIANTSSQGLSMAWERINVDIPTDWEYSLCDIGICYIGIPPGAMVAEDILIDSEGFFGINLTPHSEGSGMVQIKIWDTFFPDDKMLLTWYFSTGIVGLNEEVEPQAITAFPNPVHDVMYLRNETQELIEFNLFNQSGQLIFSENTSEGLQEFDFSGLSSGLYCLTAVNNNYKTKIRILKL